MSDVFIAHVEEDADVALAIALRLEESGYSAWCYEVDSLPGAPYLIQTGNAIDNSKAVVVLISPHSLGSRQVTQEVVRAHETSKEFIPVRRRITHVEFQNRQPVWRQAIGAATSIEIPEEGVASIAPRIIAGLKNLGFQPATRPNWVRIRAIRKALGELSVPTGEPGLEHSPALLPALEQKERVAAAWMRRAFGRARGLATACTGLRNKKLATIILACVIGVTAIVAISIQNEPIPPQEPTEVRFSDPNLDLAVRQAIMLEQPHPILTSDLERLTVLEAPNKAITDLRGLEYATDLIELDLWGNQIGNISPLANLTDLTNLELSYNNIIGISPLASLRNLRLLALTNNQISDISPLANLTNLTELHLSSNEISDISPLANLTNLTELHLSSNRISDMLSLSNLANLTGLDLGINQVSNISPLTNLTDLVTLYLGINQITDISPLANLTELTALHLGSNQISDILPLLNLTNLATLVLHANQIISISPLLQNTGLGTGDELDLRWNSLSSDSVNISIPQLEERGVTVYY